VFADLLREKFHGIVELSPGQVSALEAHYDLLVRWNRKLNLTTIISVAEVVERHYCEALFLAAHLPVGALRIVDIGSGPGFPGFPVAVLRPDCSVALVESHQRKAVFLREASRNIANVRVIAQRAEEIAEEFDHVISRAVSYKDLGLTLQNLGSFADLLTGAEQPPNLGFDWNEPIPVPWGIARFLRIGRRGSPVRFSR
jgi:16S rRNA (guanine(527)-N(7))-methyltransferase RsmG